MISEGQPLLAGLLSVPRPTLAAMEAVSDCDQVYGQKLFAIGHHGWARPAATYGLQTSAANSSVLNVVPWQNLSLRRSGMSRISGATT